MIKNKVLAFTTGLGLIVPTITLAASQAFGKANGAEIALYLLYALTLAIILVVIHNFWNVITSFGGVIGKGLNLIGSGVILISFQIVLKTLGQFNLDYLKYLLRSFPRTYDIFHAALQVIGLLLVVWGLKTLASVYKEEPKSSEESR